MMCDAWEPLFLFGFVMAVGCWIIYAIATSGGDLSGEPGDGGFTRYGDK